MSSKNQEDLFRFLELKIFRSSSKKSLKKIKKDPFSFFRTLNHSFFKEKVFKKKIKKDLFLFFRTQNPSFFNKKVLKRKIKKYNFFFCFLEFQIICSSTKKSLKELSRKSLVLIEAFLLYM